MSTIVRSFRRATVALLAVLGVSLAPNPSAPGLDMATASSHRPAPLVAMDPPADEINDQPDDNGTATDGSAGGGSLVPQNQNYGRPGASEPKASPAVSAGTEHEGGDTRQDVGLMAVAIGSSTLAAALGALVLIGWWRNRMPATNRRPAAGAAIARAGPDRPEPGWRPAPAERPVRRPTVLKDEPYRPRHRLPRRQRG